MAAIPATSAPPSLLGTRRGKLILLLLCAVGFIDLLDASIVNIALPEIRAHLGFSVQSLQWVASAYLLTYGGFLLLGGRSADLLGRRRLLVAGTALFGISSLACGLAGSEGVLIGGRLAQGVGAAMMTPAALSILTTSFHTRGDRVKALGAWGGVGAVSGAAGSVFGGVLTSEVSWRWVFFVNLPVVAFILVASFRLIDGERPKAPPLRDFDTVGAGLITSGMLLLVYVLVNAPTVGWGTARTLGELAGALALVALFVFNEQRHSNPLVPLSLFKIKGLWEADVTQVLAMAGFYTMFFLVTLYMEEVLRYSPIRAGLAYLPVTVGAAVGAGMATKAIPRIGTRPLIAAGALLGAAGVFLLSRVPVDGTYAPDILPGIIIMGAGVGLVLVGVQNAANGGVPADKAGLAASLITASFQLGGALGLAVFVSLATGRTNQLLAAHARPSEALTLGFQRGLLGASIALVIAALIALRAPNVRVVDMAPDADDNQPLPVPAASGPAPEAPHVSAGQAELPALPGRAAEGTAVPGASRKHALEGSFATLLDCAQNRPVRRANVPSPLRSSRRPASVSGCRLPSWRAGPMRVIGANARSASPRRTLATRSLGPASAYDSGRRASRPLESPRGTRGPFASGPLPAAPRRYL